MFKTEGQEVKKAGLPKSLEPGVAYAHIYSGTVRTSKTGKKALELILEGPELPNFEGWAVDKDNQEGEKFKGQSSRVNASIYISDFNSDDINKNEILAKLLCVADFVDSRKEVDAIGKNNNITTIEQWVEAAIQILKGKDLFWFLKGTEEEYNGKTIVKLSLPKIKYCSSEKSELPAFDKANKYHYTALATKPVNGFEPVNDDFNV